MKSPGLEELGAERTLGALSTDGEEEGSSQDGRYWSPAGGRAPQRSCENWLGHGRDPGVWASARGSCVPPSAPSKREGACAERRALSRAAVSRGLARGLPRLPRAVRAVARAEGSCVGAAGRKGDHGASPGLALWGRPLLSLTWAGGWARPDPGGPAWIVTRALALGGGGSPSSPPGAGGVGASGAPPRRPLRPQAAGQPKPSRMEVLDEFDSEFPQSVTFCQLIPEEDFERQAATYTESALRLLFLSLDRNPALDERVVRKGKQAECERRGLLSFLWVRAREGGAPGFRGGGGAPVSALLELLVGDFKEAAPARRLTRPASSSLPLPLSSQAKVSCAVQGELNCCNSMGALEMHQRLEQLKSASTACTYTPRVRLHPRWARAAWLT